MKIFTLTILLAVALGLVYPQASLAQDTQEVIELPEQTITIEESRRFVEVTPVPVVAADTEVSQTADTSNLVLILSSTAVAISLISIIINLIIWRTSSSKKSVIPVAQEV